MLQAMNTGHDGSLSTCHANSPTDALRRLETMVLTGGSTCRCGAVPRADRQRRRPGGPGRPPAPTARRRVVAVAEVAPDPDAPVRTTPVAVGPEVLAGLARPSRAPVR